MVVCCVSRNFPFILVNRPVQVTNLGGLPAAVRTISNESAWFGQFRVHRNFYPRSSDYGEVRLNKSPGRKPPDFFLEMA
jgi:hypothetical protein